LSSCQKALPPDTNAANAEPEPHPEVATNWTPRTELFVEYPPLVVGKPSRFAIHFTRLDNFKAVAQGTAEVRLETGEGAPLRFRASTPSRPGIFGVDVTPSKAGEVRLAISFSGEGIEDTHNLGLVPVAATPAAALHEHEDEGGDKIAFLKEQQWTLDFATAVVEDRAIQASLRIPAEVEPRSGGRAEVDAPFDGRLLLDAAPVVGSRVQAGQVLARVLLPVNNPGDLPGLELARREAMATLQLARKDRDRAERLARSGAVPAKRVDEAATAVITAEARLQAAETRLTQFESSRQGEGENPGAKPFAVKAPISGIVESVKAAPGSNVKAGDALFQLIDLDTVYVSAIVPESEFPRIRGLTGAELEIPGIDTPRRLNKLITIGRVVDSPSRTFPVIYQIDNSQRLVAVNQTVYVRLLFASGPLAPAIPESAVVDDSGRPIIFLQQSGETFLRRPVKLGERAGGMVQVLDGVNPGERIVVKGAHLIRLASMSNQVPAHGHVH
jgi:RND family efflux transporter MFP subunit